MSLKRSVILFGGPTYSMHTIGR